MSIRVAVNKGIQKLPLELIQEIICHVSSEGVSRHLFELTIAGEAIGFASGNHPSKSFWRSLFLQAFSSSTRMSSVQICCRPPCFFRYQLQILLDQTRLFFQCLKLCPNSDRRDEPFLQICENITHQLCIQEYSFVSCRATSHGRRNYGFNQASNHIVEKYSLCPVCPSARPLTYNLIMIL